MAKTLSLEDRALGILSNTLDRPSPSKVRGLDFKDIDGAAEKLGCRDVDNVTKPVLGINECAVDPVAALKLQVLTINYFSSACVQNRIGERLRIKS